MSAKNGSRNGKANEQILVLEEPTSEVEGAIAVEEATPAPLTVQALADEIQMNAEDLLPLLEKMGLKKATGATVVPENIAKNARLAVAARNRIVAPQAPALAAGKDEQQPEAQQPQTQAEQPKPEVSASGSDVGASGGIEVSRKLKLSEIKDVAKATGLTQTVVKQLDQALHDRACQLAFLEGFQRQQREQETKAALETGELTAKLQDIQQRSKQMDEQETLLIQEGLSNTNHPTELAKKMGIDLDGILGSLQEKTEGAAIAGLAQSDIIQAILDGKQPTEEQLANPFIKLAYQRSQALKNQ